MRNLHRAVLVSDYFEVEEFPRKEWITMYSSDLNLIVSIWGTPVRQLILIRLFACTPSPYLVFKSLLQLTEYIVWIIIVKLAFRSVAIIPPINLLYAPLKRCNINFSLIPPYITLTTLSFKIMFYRRITGFYSYSSNFSL